MKNKILTLLTLASLIFILFSTSSCRQGRNGMPEEEVVMMKRLNDSITNALSDIPELAGLDSRMEKYIKRWEMKGASLAITRGDSLVYAKGYGWADEELGIPMEPGHILRMASVSKLITATGIMVLQDRDSLSIRDTVFGPRGILNDSIFTSLIRYKDYKKITIEHLLRHQGGFGRDPLFSSRDVKHQLRIDHVPEAEDFYSVVLNRPLRFKPGSWQQYSNLGYLLLSEIIEKVSGMPYEEFIRTQVLEPAGCFDMHIAGNYYEDKKPNEVRYYTHEGDGKYIEDYTDNGMMVERCYGGNNIPLLQGAGAWCGSPIEIARLVASIDGSPEVPDIISPEAVEQMTGYYDRDTFSLGWNDTHPDKGWTRTGTLSGTCALVHRYPDGECWILISNTSTWRGPNQAKYTETLFRQCRELYSSLLPKKNMFE